MLLFSVMSADAVICGLLISIQHQIPFHHTINKVIAVHSSDPQQRTFCHMQYVTSRVHAMQVVSFPCFARNWWILALQLRLGRCSRIPLVIFIR